MQMRQTDRTHTQSHTDIIQPLRTPLGINRLGLCRPEQLLPGRVETGKCSDTQTVSVFTCTLVRRLLQITAAINPAAVKIRFKLRLVNFNHLHDSDIHLPHQLWNKISFIFSQMNYIIKDPNFPL